MSERSDGEEFPSPQTLEASKSIPERFLGDGPEEWESDRGSLLDRLRQNAHSRLRIAELCGQEAKVEEGSTQQSAQLGQAALRLIRLCDAGSCIQAMAAKEEERAMAQLPKRDLALEPTSEDLFRRVSQIPSW
jgi:hypothetical protein